MTVSGELERYERMNDIDEHIRHEDVGLGEGGWIVPQTRQRIGE
jgi:hypothetical protein